MTLGEFIKARGLTQGQFAAMIDANQGEVAHYVAGSRIPRRETMRAIARATDNAVTADDFYGLRADMQPPGAAA